MKAQKTDEQILAEPREMPARLLTDERFQLPWNPSQEEMRAL